MASEVNQKPGETGRIDPRLFLREEELDNGIALLLLSERVLAAALRRNQESTGLNMPALRLLVTIRFKPGLTVSELRDETGSTRWRACLANSTSVISSTKRLVGAMPAGDACPCQRTAKP